MRRNISVIGFGGRKILNFLVAALLGMLLVACAQLPDQGPGSVEIKETHRNNNSSGFLLIDVDKNVAEVLLHQSTGSLKLRFGKGRPANSDRIGPGDVLNVTIWESDPNGLFSAGSAAVPGAGTNTGRVQGVEVDRRGYIRFPYVGRIRVRGMSTSRLSEVIRRKLSQQTTTPQVHVERVKKESNVVTVIGGVKAPGIYQIGATNTDVLDILASAGGSAYPTFETKLSLTRRGRTASMYLDRMIARPHENIYVRPQDEISIERIPRNYMVFGAVTVKGLVDFNQPKLTVLEAIAKASGLDHLVADPAGVFLFRFESRKTVEKLGRLDEVKTAGALIPVIYRFDMRNANQYFYAKAIGVHHKDAIYAANAPAVQLQKFLGILAATTGIAADVSKLMK